MPELIKAIKCVQVKRHSKPRRFKTNHPTWLKIRKAQLKREPLCRHCKAKGITTPATDVDHIDGDSWNDDPGNYQSLCHICHTIKTNTHDGGLGHSRI